MKRRPLDLSAVLAAWPTAPQPAAGFADRVMAACLAPPVAQIERPAVRAINFRGALAVALLLLTILLPLYAAHHAQSPATLAALPGDRDLGPLED